MRTLLAILGASQPELVGVVGSLTRLTPNGVGDWNDEALGTMSERLQMTIEPPEATVASDARHNIVQPCHTVDLPTGWNAVENTWSPRPIGVFTGPTRTFPT
jgi:hypothetical protein